MAERLLPRWPGLIGTVASVAGLGIAGYLTYEHFTGSSSLVCSDKGIVNCLAVTTSSYAMVAGVPVAVLGLIFFAVTLVLQLPVVWKWPNPIIRKARRSGALRSSMCIQRSATGIMGHSIRVSPPTHMRTPPMWSRR
jgi:uncharacterized membrane protein